VHQMANPHVTHQPFAIPGGAPVHHPSTLARVQEKQEARRYWKYATLVAILLLAVITVRMHELVGPLRYLRPTLTLGVFGVGLVIMRSSVKARRDAMRHLPMKLMMAYAAWIGLMLPFAIWKARAFLTFQGIVPAVLLVLALCMVAPTRKVLEKVTLAYGVCLAVMAGAVWVVGTSEGGRMSVGGTYDANDMAALMACGTPLILGIIVRGRGRTRWLMIGALVLVGSAIVASQSRGGFLALLAATVVFGLGFKASKRIGMVIALVVAGLIGWTFTGEDFRERMGSILELEDDYNFQTFDGRIAIWTRGIGYAFERPITGVGPSNFGFRDGQWLAEHGMTGKWSAAHNAYIQSFADLGFPGGLLFLGMLLVAARNTYALWRPRLNVGKGFHRPEYLASVLALMVAAFFLSLAYSFIVFGVLGIAALADRVRRAEDRRNRTAKQMTAAALQQQAMAAAVAAGQNPAQAYGLAVPYAVNPSPFRGLPGGGSGTAGG